MSLALLFPGQGTQHAGMLPWLENEPGAAPMRRRLAAALGEDWHARLSDATWSSGNAVAQPLITGLSLAAWQVLAPLLPLPAAVAGYSVGELPAFAAAGVLEADTAFDLAVLRAALMSASAPDGQTGLLAVSGLADSGREPIRQRHGLAEAIRLQADRVVLGGRAEDLLAAELAFVAAGAQCNRLAVRLASHTPWVHTAVAPFARHLGGVAFRKPQVLLVCNRTGGPVRDEASLKAALAGQIDHTVPWDRCLEALEERRPACVLEVGPGATLARLWNDRDNGIPARSVDEFRSVQAIARWVATAIG